MIKTKTANPVSLGGILLLIVCFILPFHRFGCNTGQESILDTMQYAFADGRLDNTHILMAAAPNVFAVYLLIILLLLILTQGRKFDKIIDSLNILAAMLLFYALMWFYSSNQLFQLKAWPLIPVIIYLGIIFEVVTVYIYRSAKATTAIGRFYLLQLYGALGSLIFYLSLPYFFSSADEFPGVSQVFGVLKNSFCYGYLLSVLATLLIMLGALRDWRNSWRISKT
ncbi:MAG: hypothetical protein ABIH01_01000 [Candidatus Omnitrophota bacterium]